MIEELASSGIFNYFGLEAWRHYFGKKVKLEKAPAVPWDEAELKQPLLKQRHFLFLGLDRLDGKPLDILQWRKIYSDKKKQPKFYLDWYLKDAFAGRPLELRWYWMTVGLVPNSKNLAHEQMAALLPPGYEMPSGIARVTANLLWYLINDTYLDSERDQSSIAETGDDGRLVRVAGFPIDGLAIATGFGTHALCGVAASRKLPDA